MCIAVSVSNLPIKTDSVSSLAASKNYYGLNRFFACSIRYNVEVRTMPIFAEMSMTTFWIIAMVVFLVIEAVTVGIVSVWFAIGALFAMVTAMLGANLWVQIAVFLVVSAVTLYFTRPLVKKYVNNKVEPTNADMLIGKECRVVETIDNLTGTGAVYVDGKTWTARTVDEEIIPEGQLVKAERIEGVKLIVSKIAPEA